MSTVLMVGKFNCLVRGVTRHDAISRSLLRLEMARNSGTWVEILNINSAVEESREAVHAHPSH